MKNIDKNRTPFHDENPWRISDENEEMENVLLKSFQEYD